VPIRKHQLGGDHGGAAPYGGRPCVETPDQLDWSGVLARERAAIREPDGQSDGPGRPLTGLAFSGGGIRSATFNLGIVQALAELKLLRELDYLSCVSGGGYIGGWLSAFIQRHCRGRVEDAEAKLCTGGAENPAIRFLRSYSNYLTPQASVLSADALSAVATYLRNLYLNLSLLLLAMSALLLVPRLLVWSIRWLADWEGVHADLAPLFGGGVAALALAMLFIGFNFGGATHRTRPFYTRTTGVLTLVVLPVVVSAWFITYGLYAGSSHLENVPLGTWVTGGTLIYGLPWLFGWLGGHLLRRRDGSSPLLSARRALMIALYTALAGALGGLLLAGMAEIMQYIRDISHVGHSYRGSWPVSALGTALMLNAYSLAVVGHIGLMGRHFSHDSREWWSRLGGWLLLSAVLWTTLFGIVFGAPAFFSWAHEAVIAAGGITWVLSTLAGVMLGRGADTAGGNQQTWRDRAAQLMPYVFILGLLGLLSLGLHQLLTLKLLCTACTRSELTGQTHFLQVLFGEAPNFKHIDIRWISLLFAACLAGTVTLAWRLDVNLFSIYYFYRQRLVRCYLGAARCQARAPHLFTGFDPDDDLRLASLSTTAAEPDRCQRPYPIHNAAMNLVAGKQLAWQERRAAAFAFTPLTTGYGFTLPDAQGDRVDHYRPTAQYMDGVWLGTAMAISGAAASPNMGYHSSPALTFLMTVFNVRLGHWCPNPANSKLWTRPNPSFGGGYLLRELFGQTDYAAPFVYLSDGGHFENLGIYELVRRRCACILAIDAGQDGASQFEDLGNAIRKCYADFGITIEIQAEDMKQGYSVVGRIRYLDAPTGDLIYIKPRLVGSEPADLLNYKCTHPGFPHQSTADQWFDESQFESYRKLGHHIGQAVFGAALDAATERQRNAPEGHGQTLEWLCAVLREQQSTN
jgi:hypothetical protein